MDPARYAQVVQTALDQGMRLLEAGQEGGDEALATVLKTVKIPQEREPITVTTRLGYRTLSPDGDSHLTRRWDGDVTVEKQIQNDDIEVEVVHNMSPSFLTNHLSKCPLLKEATDSIAVVPMIHNPEVQIDWGEKNPHDVLYEKLVHAFRGMEEAVASNQISTYGVVSNGLALPATHPLHLDYKLVLRAAQEAADDSSRPNLSMLQLPANVFEPMGFQVARNIQSFLEKKWPMDVTCMRPLTWYPEQGTGAGNAVSLVDYSLPNSEGGVISTLTMEGPPLSYQAALNMALSHFDGTALLEQKKERDLTGEERETLEGCKLLQSILHDLDVELSSALSFAAYEKELVEKVIPTLYGRFEELDEESARILQVRIRQRRLRHHFGLLTELCLPRCDLLSELRFFSRISFRHTAKRCDMPLRLVHATCWSREIRIGSCLR
jgi:hypothetical protein